MCLIQTIHQFSRWGALCQPNIYFTSTFFVPKLHSNMCLSNIATIPREPYQTKYTRQLVSLWGSPSTGPGSDKFLDNLDVWCRIEVLDPIKVRVWTFKRLEKPTEPSPTGIVGDHRAFRGLHWGLVWVYRGRQPRVAVPGGGAPCTSPPWGARSPVAL